MSGADIFRSAELARVKCNVDEYGVVQSSLEQIFNSFAATQEEETANVRGVQTVATEVSNAAVNPVSNADFET